MRNISEDAYSEIEKTAIEGARKMRAFFAYEGDNSRYFQKARIGAAAINSYSRLVSTETNREALRLMAERSKNTHALPAPTD